jgi:hypothetical protein
MAGRGQHGQENRNGLVPAALGRQEISHREWDRAGVPEPARGGGVADGGLQVGAEGGWRNPLDSSADLVYAGRKHLP